MWLIYYAILNMLLLIDQQRSFQLYIVFVKLCYISALPTETLTKNDENPVSLGASPKFPKPNCSETLAAEKENKRDMRMVSPAGWLQVVSFPKNLLHSNISLFPPSPPLSSFSSPLSFAELLYSMVVLPSERSFPCSHSLPFLPPLDLLPFSGYDAGIRT